MKQIKIGRNSDNDVVIADATIGRNHAILTVTDDESLIIEDLGSANGTKVNGNLIRKKFIMASDRVELGSNGYLLDLKKHIPPKVNFEKEFDQLKAVYDKYLTDKIRISKKLNQKSSLMRALPMAIPGLITLSMGFVANEVYKPYLTISGGVLSVLIPMIAMGLSSGQMARRDELIERLNAEFQVDYVCPKCRRFLGYISWQSIKNTGGCSCKAKW
jgi:hypothetical protein